jgi:hypothetical protein
VSLCTGTDVTGVIGGAGSVDPGGNVKFNLFLDMFYIHIYIYIPATKQLSLLLVMVHLLRLLHLFLNNNMSHIPLTKQEAKITYFKTVNILTW